jgi:hypothetical protein
MTTQEVRDTLVNEADLLSAMIDLVEKYDNSGFTKQAKYIQNSWVRFFGERRSTGLALQAKSNDALWEDLDSERSQIDSYIKVTEMEPQYTEFWGTFLQCEKDILDHLINLCDGK